ncbi:MAG TPA: cupin domain-containing protein [Thermomicrobiales bacterium]|nr:cupin domain-containing protein [Thermomicrobiales bacterium]
MDASRFVTSVKALAAATHTRRAALRSVGLGGLTAGLLTAVGAPSSRAQDWNGTTPTPAGTPAASSEASFAGLTGGLPPFTMNLESSAPDVYPAGTIRWGSRRQLPTLQGVAIASERVEPDAVRELHWHLGAHELGYVLAGRGRMGIFSSDGTGDTFDVQPGSISFVPEGYTHYIQNTGEETLHLLLAFTHEQPETIDLSQALPGIPQHLLAETFGVQDGDFPFLAIRGDRSIVPVPAPQGDAGMATPVASASSPYSIQTEQVTQKEFVGGGGSARPLTTKDIPPLQGITLFTLHIVPHGLREPHWHPDTGELNYCVSGRGQIGLVAPDGSVQTFAIEPGTIGFIPSNWFHYIANVTDEPLNLIVFFAGPTAAGPHIDTSQTVGYFPPEIVAASFGVDPATFAALPMRGNVFLAAPVAND